MYGSRKSWVVLSLVEVDCMLPRKTFEVVDSYEKNLVGYTVGCVVMKRRGGIDQGRRRFEE